MRSIPPHDDEAEQATLGSVLVLPEIRDRMAKLITPGDFSLEGQGRICQTMMDLRGQGEPGDGDFGKFLGGKARFPSPHRNTGRLSLK